MSEDKVLEAVKKAGFEVLETVHIKDKMVPPFMDRLARLTPAPAGTDNFKVRHLGERVIIDARNGACSLGIIVIPIELFANLMAGVLGDPA